MHLRKSTTKLFAAAALAAPCTAIALLATATTSLAVGLTPQEEKLAEAAKKEGAVTLLNPIFSDRTGERLGEAFKKHYNLGANFKFNNLRKGTGQTVAQVRQEIVAGRFTVDILLVSAPGFFDEAAKRDAFVPLESGYWQNHAELAKSAGQYANYPYVVMPFAYSFQPVWNASCPGMSEVNITSYPDVGEAGVQGQDHRLRHDQEHHLHQHGAVAAGEQRCSTSFRTGTSSRRPTRSSSSAPSRRCRWSSPASGRSTCGTCPDASIRTCSRRPNSDKVLKVGTYKEGQVMLGNQAAVIKGGPNPNAAKLLMEFMLKKEGTDIFIEGEAMYSFMKGYEPPAETKPWVFDLTKTKLLGLKDWIASAKLQKEVRDVWQSKFQ
jgi:ABC-type Fe3+ transport system substrate-binding protein